MVVSAAAPVITVALVLIVRRWAALAEAVRAALAAEAVVSAEALAAASAAVPPEEAAAEDRFNARKTGNNIFADFFVFSG